MAGHSKKRIFCFAVALNGMQSGSYWLGHSHILNVPSVPYDYWYLLLFDIMAVVAIAVSIVYIITVAFEDKESEDEQED